MDNFKDLAGPTATVLAALIAASITFLISVFTKEAKVSEFRQAWIESLRNDLAKFVGIWFYINHEFETSNDNEKVGSAAFWLALKPEIILIEELQIRIELRLNPKEHLQLIELIHDLTQLQQFIGKPFNKRKSAIDALTTESQRVLKVEWLRVKRGEATYRWIKIVAIAFVVLALSALSILWWAAPSVAL